MKEDEANYTTSCAVCEIRNAVGRNEVREKGNNCSEMGSNQMYYRREEPNAACVRDWMCNQLSEAGRNDP